MFGFILLNKVKNGLARQQGWNKSTNIRPKGKNRAKKHSTRQDFLETLTRYYSLKLPSSAEGKNFHRPNFFEVET